MAEEREKVRAGLSEEEMRDNVVRLAFRGDPLRFQEFLAELNRFVPPDTAAVLRGSSVTGVRAEDGAPFDADGHGTSDLDVTLVGGHVLDWFHEDGFYLPGIHSKPLSDEHPDIAPDLVPARRALSKLAGRPVNIQATRDWIMFVREYVMNQPYLTLLGKVEDP